MRKYDDIIGRYTAGQATLEETNAALKEAGAGFHLDPTRNTFTGEELLATKADTAETATGWGLLDTGTVTMDKVQVKDGHLVNCDMGAGFAMCIIGGKTFIVKGDALAEKE
jgi:hypothetical protein